MLKSCRLVKKLGFPVMEVGIDTYIDTGKINKKESQKLPIR
jgi:hypothetical protein